MTAKQLDVEIWVDGACSGNPGPGGWAAVLRYQKPDGSWHEKEVSGPLALTTNNCAELMAVLRALETLTLPCLVTLYSDSANVQGWLVKGWKRNNAAVRDLCADIERAAVAGGHAYTVEKVSGHAGVELNERCDVLAKAAIVK
jgi:ribonuclease HI